MKVKNKKLKEKIVNKIKNSTSDNFNFIENSFVKFLISKGYLEKDGEKIKPTEKLIFLKFNEIKNLIKEINEEVSKGSFSKDEISLTKKLFNQAYEIIRDNFGAELQRSNEIFLCPYCQRNYINIIDIDEERKVIKPDLDHFYPKSIYPYLACCIENLVPSCQFCNQRIKRDNDTFNENILHPLNEKIFDKIEFDIILKTFLIFIKEKSKLPEEIKRYIKFFYIEETYSKHTEIAKDIYDKKKKYNDVKKKHLKSLGYIGELEVERVVFYEYENIDTKRNPMWKLKKDLYKAIKK